MKKTTSANRMKLEPTPRGAKLLKAILDEHGSIARCARRVDVSVETVRRAIYSDEPVSMQVRVVEGFERAGIPRSLLPLAG